MALRGMRAYYQAKDNTTGLTDVKGQVYLDDVAKAVGGSAVLFTELDPTNAPGIYYFDITQSQLVTWGATIGSKSTVFMDIDSATAPAQAPFKQDVFLSDTDDIYAKLGTPVGASVSADIAAVKADTVAIKNDLETGSDSLAIIHAAVLAIQNNAGFAVPVPAQMIIPLAGSNSYRIPVSVYNENNMLIDPDTNTITVAAVNQAGASRNSYLGSTTMTRDSLGQYHVDLAIPSTASQEELLFTFSYSVGGSATARRAVTNLISDIAGSGYALQSTLLSVQSDVSAIKSDVESATFGLAHITSDLEDATNGLPAIKGAINSANAILGNGTYGNAALKAELDGIEGSGFVTGTDSLRATANYLRAKLFLGGRAV